MGSRCQRLLISPDGKIKQQKQQNRTIGPLKTSSISQKKYSVCLLLISSVKHVSESEKRKATNYSKTNKKTSISSHVSQ